jgi:hypothetical protein
MALNDAVVKKKRLKDEAAAVGKELIKMHAKQFYRKHWKSMIYRMCWTIKVWSQD